MINESLLVKRYEGNTHRQRISIISEPALGHHVMLGINTHGVDIACHMDVDDLDKLYIAIGNVLAQLEAHEDAKEAA